MTSPSQIKLTFLLPTYKVRWLREAISSILGQSFGDFELVIVNDKSPEDVKGVVDEFGDERIRYYENEVNIGGQNLVHQWNRCLDLARGEYVVIAGDDDVYHPDFATECLRLAEKYPEVGIIRARTEQIDEEGRLLAIDNSFPEWMSQAEYAFRYRDGSAFICIGNFMFRTDQLRERGIVDFPKALGSDIATSIDLACRGMANTSEILFSFRQSSEHISGRTDAPVQRIEAIEKLFSWLKTYDFQIGEGRYEDFYRSQMTERDWSEKERYDYYNQVIRKGSLLRSVRWIMALKQLSACQKLKMVSKRLKDAMVSE